MPSQSQSSSSLLQLLILSSSNLPIGAYCYSQGVESAIENHLIHDETSALNYFTDYIELVLARYELPMLVQLIKSNSKETFTDLAKHYIASRESHEFLLETQQISHAYNAWLRDVLSINIDVPTQYGFMPLYAKTIQQLKLPLHDAVSAYAFTQIENLVLAVVKTVPLGQMAGQRVLWQLQHAIESASEQAQHRTQSMSSNLPNLAILSSQHEEQYSRLYRS